MSNYYFVATSLPELELGVQPEITFSDLQQLLQNNLFSSDYDQVKSLLRFADIQNMRAIWKQEEPDVTGNLDPVDLEEAILSQGGLPEYIYNYLIENKLNEDRLAHFAKLVNDYFIHEAKQHKGFLRDYLLFERDLRLVCVGLRAKMTGRDILKELQFEDPNDPLIASLIAQKDSKTFIPPNGFGELSSYFEQHGNDPYALFQDLEHFRFKKIDELVGLERFSMRAILGYVAKFLLVDKLQKLNKEQGMAVLQKAIHPDAGKERNGDVTHG